MPLGTALQQSPGWNEGKARYETLGKRRQKQIELLQERHYCARIGIYTLDCAAPNRGSISISANNKPRVCALSYAGVSSHWGSLQTVLNRLPIASVRLGV